MTRTRTRCPSSFGQNSGSDFSGSSPPTLALARQWAAHQNEVGMLPDKLERLAGIIATAGYALERSGA